MINSDGQPETYYDTVDTPLDTVDTPSYRTRLINFVNIHLTEEGCRLVYRILSFLFENDV